ncbi:helix-turn-helix domain-containing protein [Staphylococcus aureus]|nr:helix-turn-helix domain-containing protein [Staphylococcus aureus]
MISNEEQEYRIALGQSLKRHREMMGFSLRDVEKVTEIHRSTIHSYEEGTRNTPIERVHQLADVYRARPSDIFQGAYDRLEYGVGKDPNRFLEIKLDLDCAKVIIKSKLNHQQEIIHLEHKNIHSIKTKFNV